MGLYNIQTPTGLSSLGDSLFLTAHPMKYNFRKPASHKSLLKDALRLNKSITEGYHTNNTNIIHKTEPSQTVFFIPKWALMGFNVN